MKKGNAATTRCPWSGGVYCVTWDKDGSRTRRREPAARAAGTPAGEVVPDRLLEQQVLADQRG
jgi:hypothetical protein